MNPAADRNLLFGILALQMDFIRRDDLIAAMNAWVLDKAKPLGQLLVEQGKLAPETRQALDGLVRQHLKLHGDDPQRSLAALAPAGIVSEALSSVNDADVRAGFAAVTDPQATTSYRSVAAGEAVRYQVLRPHARGGLGEVFVALDREVHREVALKEIQPQHADDPSSRGRFVREAEITGGLEHPGIVPVYGLGQYADGRPFYAMRLIQGETLQDAVRRLHAGEPGLTLRGLLTRFVAVCNAVAYAHSRGVLHRDLKPANVMLGKFGETLVVDWGLAKAVGPALADGASEASDEPALRPHSDDGSAVTLAGSALGTPAYMSPEQASGRLDRLGPASDVYSLGATLYTIVTGRPPVEGRDVAEVLEKVRKGDLEPARRVKPSAPAALEAVCREALALRPEDRYPTALALAADVEAWLADEPVGAWREPWAVRARRWLGRHRTLATAAAAVVVVAALAAGVGLVVVSAANESEHRARNDEAAARQDAEKASEQLRYNLYVSTMNLVSHEWDEGNVAHALNLLKRCVPQQPGEKDLRGWEWHFYDRVCHGELRVIDLGKHGAVDVRGAVFNPDGTRLAVATEEGRLWSWDVATGERLWSAKDDTLMLAVAYSPDGRQVATGSDNGTVKLWDAATGQLLKTLSRHTNQVYWVAFHPDGTRLVSASSGDGTVLLWDLATASPRPLPVTRPVNAFFSPGGARLVVSTSDGTISVCDVETGKPLHVFRGRARDERAYGYSPDGSRIATAVAQDGMIRLLDATTGKEVRVLRGRAGIIRVVFNPDGTRLASAGADGSVRLWDAASGQEVRVLKGHGGYIHSVAFSPDGTRLASAGSDKTVRFWDALGSGAPRALKGYGTAPVADLSYSPDGTRLACCSGDGVVPLWDAAGIPVRLPPGQAGGGFRVAYSPDSRRFATAGTDGKVRLWDAATGALQRVLMPPTLEGTSSNASLAFSPDGRQLASAGAQFVGRVERSGIVCLWDVDEDRPPRVLTGDERTVFAVTFHPAQRQLAASGYEGKVRVWDLAAEGAPRDFKSDVAPLYGVAYSPDGTRLAAGGINGGVFLWNLTDGLLERTLMGHTDMAYRVRYSPDGTRLATAGRDGTVRLWDPLTGAELARIRTGSKSWGCVAFSPDGTRLAFPGPGADVIIGDGRPWGPEAAVEREAVDLVDGLFNRPMLRDEALELIRAHKTLGEPARRLALELAARYPDGPDRFVRAARNVVRERDVAPGVYRLAVTWTETARRLGPDDLRCLNTLGMAYYRVGRHADALTALTDVDRLNKGRSPTTQAFLAMTHQRLGHADEAKAALARLHELMKEPNNVGWETPPLTAEAEEVLGGK